MGLNESVRVAQHKQRQRKRFLKLSIIMAAVMVVMVALAWVINLNLAGKEELLESGKEYAAQDLHQEASIQFRKALEEDASYGEARLELARAYMRLGQLRQAMAEAIRAADLMPQNVEAQLEAIRFLLVTRQFEDARARADALLKVDPKNVEALIARAGATARLVDLENGIFEMERAVQLIPQDPNAYMMLGALRSSQDLKAAEAAFKKAVEVAPKSPAAMRALAAFYWRSGNAMEAEVWIRRLVDLDPLSVASQQLLVSFLIATNREGEAEAPLKDLVAKSKNPAAEFMLADYYTQLGRPGDATPILERLAGDKTNQVQAKLRLARFYFLDGRSQDAHRMIADVLAADGRNVNALTMRANLLLNERNFAQALEVANDALRVQASSVDAKRMVAEAHAGQGNLELAIRALTELLQVDSRQSQARVRLAQLYLLRKQLDTAKRVADEAVTADPNAVAPLLVRAQVHLARGETDAAARDLAPINQAAPDIAQLQVLLGDVSLRRRQFQEARRAFDRARVLAPNDIDALRGMLTLEILERRPRRAVEMLEQRLKGAGYSTDLAMLASSVYMLAGDAVKSERALRQVIENDPTRQAAARLELANLYLEQNLLDQARNELAFVTRGDAAAGAQTMIGMILQAQDKPTEAQAVFEKVLADHPETSLAANNLAWLLAETGVRLDESLNLAQTATRLDPANASFRDTLGWVYLKRGVTDLAIRAFSESVRLAPNEPQYRYHLAMAYSKAGESEKASSELKRVLTQRPDFKDAQVLLESLPKS